MISISGPKWGVIIEVTRYDCWYNICRFSLTRDTCKVAKHIFYIMHNDIDKWREYAINFWLLFFFFGGPKLVCFFSPRSVRRRPVLLYRFVGYKVLARNCTYVASDWMREREMNARVCVRGFWTKWQKKFKRERENPSIGNGKRI